MAFSQKLAQAAGLVESQGGVSFDEWGIDGARLSREEIQSINEELTTINQEHQSTIEELTGLTPEAEALFNLVKQAGADLGQSIGWQPSGGVCDGNNIAACGVPVVDTMGVRGGAIHSEEEYLIRQSLGERAGLSALVLARLSEGAL